MSLTASRRLVFYRWRNKMSARAISALLSNIWSRDFSAKLPDQKLIAIQLVV
jgi:hypothetical protein